MNRRAFITGLTSLIAAPAVPCWELIRRSSIVYGMDSQGAYKITTGENSWELKYVDSDFVRFRTGHRETIGGYEFA